ncbi:MAG: universal stress protein [Aeromicrobium sp.]
METGPDRHVAIQLKTHTQEQAIMSKADARPIIVGISEEGQSEGALRFAVDEAVRQRCRLTVVHALQPATIPPPAGDPLIGYGSQERTHVFADEEKSTEAHRLVTDVARRARAMGNGRVAVDTDVPVGHRVHAIIEAAENARLIVLQHRDLPTFERIFARSTSTRVSAKAHCPVVTVPPVWDPNLHHNRITVAIDDIENSADILRVAFEDAARRLARIDIVHASRYMGSEVDIIESRDSEDEMQTRRIDSFDQLLASWRKEFPRVAVEQHLVRQSTVDALLEHSRESDLLILGRFKRSFPIPLPLPLGSIARAMVSGAHCPIEIVPHGASGPTKPKGGSGND